MSKLVGVLGEEAAEKILQTEKFAEKFGKQPFDKIRRGTRYGVQGSFDLVASHDGNFVFGVFAEVKNWSTATWTSDLTSVLSQLDRHNAGVAEYFKLLGAKANKRTAGKVLMVGDKGFKGLAIEAQETIRAELKTRGWRLEMIPQSMIQTGEAFIDALR